MHQVPRTARNEAIDNSSADEPPVFRRPEVRDGAAMWRLVREAGTLDENSPYAYLLMCRHFADTCIVAEAGDRLAGCVTAFIPPRQPDVVFVWQIAVAPHARRSGLGKQLLRQLLALPACRSARFLEATVTPGNQPSRRLFESLAAELGGRCQWQEGFARSDFPHAAHDEEQLVRISLMESTNAID